MWAPSKSSLAASPDKYILAAMGATSLGYRVRRSRLHADISVEELARSIRRAVFTVYRYEWGKLKPPPEVLAAIASRCGVNLMWLEHGEGAMLPRKARSA